ncbi:MAG: RdgB/HAM1 family non-canonical purine NTP pyrophosphatase [Rhodanobacteraceae bacterium]|nr:RdgB/HAM1 family non-canonical purine NTP pyrophosphatase [Rhodanobacteraceae bacterium]MBK7044261.1 RdgB/HAM1 family non-canonical purine NTP pyrophosphatase [Rhodanobacteraceae bacterium]MBP9154284.1 RdgB/HAM1 family non-canonical purine NTP pyrophosphatase [Xanthomonadales bacterium]HQW81667.1 RdgB/HAM1 family non-canonical purine NTP pyrophosphatase [Pseudomonadota bacterium]
MRLVVATGNLGKLAEIRHVLADADIDLVAQAELGIPAVDETGTTFIENAILKARQACTLSGLPAIADDSGLIVDALNGAPGLISAHYAGAHGDTARNIAKVLDELRGVPEAQRTARLYSVVVLMRHAADPQPIVAEGIIEGRVLEAPRGSNGFGYQPIFFLPELGLGSAELPSEHWHRISHRAQALAGLRARWPFA